MRYWLFLLGFLLAINLKVFAEEGGTTAQFLWVPETTIETSFKAQMGVGLLDSPGLTGGRGTPITNYFGVNYAVTPDLGISIGLPLAGTLSNGNDDYGIGNIQMGTEYVIPLDRLSFGLGVNLSLPTAQTRATLGVSTRQFVQFVDDQFAVSPYVVLSYVRDRLVLSIDLGTDLELFTERTAGIDRFENILFYDGAAAMSIVQNIWGTIEFGGFSTLTYDQNMTQLFAGPGIRYQDHEISLGFHLLAPFRRPSRDIIDFITACEFRVLF